MRVDTIKRIIKDKIYCFDWIRFHGGFNWMPDSVLLKLAWRIYTGERLNLDYPMGFNEKLQWIKLNDRDPKYTQMVDKYEAKKYVANIIGESYVIPIIKVCDSLENIDFDSLPKQFVIKCTHDSGGLVVCKDKSKLDLEAVRKKINKSLGRDYYKFSREWPYKDVKRRIIIEDYLENGEEGLHDYKVWCFNGRAEYIQYITGRIGDTEEIFFDREWNKQTFTFHNPLYNGDVAKPDCLDRLIGLAEKLADGIPFVRVDFYILDNDEIKFGEITFFPMGGFEVFKPIDVDKKMGQMIDLNYKKNKDINQL